jgi:hypothetical protein
MASLLEAARDMRANDVVILGGLLCSSDFSQWVDLQAQSDSGAELRNDGPARMAGEDGGSRSGPGETPHALPQPLRQSSAR